MSDNWLQFVPRDPRFRPSAESAERAVELLGSFLPFAEDITAEFKEDIEFFHPGGNWQGVRCPACGADAEEWWSEAVDQAASSHFDNLTVVAPCCGAATSLDELDYVWPAAFGQFVLEAMNPNVRDTTPEQDAELAKVLGTPFRKVWLHI
jgi:hypothetical protein